MGRPGQSQSLVNLGHWPIEAIDGPRVRVNGRWLLSFASTNYLGLADHPAVVEAMVSTARSWGPSLGLPRQLGEDRLTRNLETALSQLVGQERALVFPSTTHVALDVLPMLAGHGGIVFVDNEAYPISLEGVNAAQRKGALVSLFNHQDPHDLLLALQKNASVSRKVIVCDGVYGVEGRVAPLSRFVQLAHSFEATVYVDDAHGIGLLGRNRSDYAPYGRGGGGTPLIFGISAENIVHVASLGKAFGIPLAFVAGPSDFIRKLWVRAPSFSHSSPPALPLIAGAIAALKVNAVDGDLLRRRLLETVTRFRNNLDQAGITLANRSYLPVQSILFANRQNGIAINRELIRSGILAVLQHDPRGILPGAALRFVISANHTWSDVDQITSALSRILRPIHLKDIAGAARMKSVAAQPSGIGMAGISL